MGYGARLFVRLTGCSLYRGVSGFPSFPPQPPLLLVWTCHASPTANCTPRDSLRCVSLQDPVPQMLQRASGLNTPRLRCLLFLSVEEHNANVRAGANLFQLPRAAALV